MAIDTKEKKISMMEWDLVYEPGLPIPSGDAIIDFGDRQHFIHGYSGIQWEPPTIPVYILTAQINDNILAVTGGSSVTDGMMAFLALHGATSDAIKDATHEFLLARGVPDSSSTDMWRTFLGGVGGITPSTVKDMKAQWWALGAPLS